MLKETDMHWIEDKDKLKSNDIGNAIIKFLVANYLEGMHDSDRNLMFTWFAGQKWRMKMETYHKLHHTAK